MWADLLTSSESESYEDESSEDRRPVGYQRPMAQAAMAQGSQESDSEDDSSEGSEESSSAETDEVNSRFKSNSPVVHQRPSQPAVPSVLRAPTYVKVNVETRPPARQSQTRYPQHVRPVTSKPSANQMPPSTTKNTRQPMKPQPTRGSQIKQAHKRVSQDTNLGLKLLRKSLSRSNPFQQQPSSARKHPHQAQKSNRGKWTCRIVLPAEVYMDTKFRSAQHLIGKGGANTRRIYNDTGAKIRVRGVNTGVLEGVDRVESTEDQMICISSLDKRDYQLAKEMGIALVSQLLDKYEEYCNYYGKERSQDWRAEDLCVEEGY